MSKIVKIKIENFKAIDLFEADFKGCTAIITAGNNKGKTSFLRGVPDRIRFIRPDVMVKEGATKGSGEMTLDSGETFIWNFDTKGSDILKYVSKDGKIKTNVTKDMGAKFFPPVFDIDKFLQSTPKEQAKQLQLILGIDFTTIDARYKSAYEDRTYLNKKHEEEKNKLIAMGNVEKIAAVDLIELNEARLREKGRLNDLYLKNKKANEIATNEYNESCRLIDKEVKEHNEAEADKVIKYNACQNAIGILQSHGYAGNEVDLWLVDFGKTMRKQKESATLYPTKPELPDPLPTGKEVEELERIEKSITDTSETNSKANLYKNFLAQTEATNKAAVAASESDKLVKQIESERKTMIESSNLPAGISITSEGITIDGFPLDKNQISTSKLYTAALRIASMNMGEVKTLYFDASYLDRSSLSEIEFWAQENDLQLLIERPDFDGGEIKYELIENA